MRRPELTIQQILIWVDHFHHSTGEWPRMDSGQILGTEDTWRRIDSALRLGLRGLSGGSSLARLLSEERGVRNPSQLSSLSEKIILQWADQHRQRTRSWPTSESGQIADAPGETWKAIDHALRLGMRSLSGSSSLARLLADERGVRNIQNLEPLNVEQILRWADAYHEKTGSWPTSQSGTIPGTHGETWSGVNAALKRGRRGFPGGSSLARLLGRWRGTRNRKRPPLLNMEQIMRWASAYHDRNGSWPHRNSGSIEESPGETWAMVDRALRCGQRGLTGKSSLFRIAMAQNELVPALTPG